MTDEAERVRLERDLYLRLLELGARDDLRPFLEDALSLVVELTRATKGYLELSPDRNAKGAPSFVIARGFSADEVALVKEQISQGIIAKALATGTTVSTASALEDPRFRGQQSVQAQRITAVLCAPIGSDPPLGVVYLGGRDKAGPFPEADRKNVETFARHLGPLADRLLAREERDKNADYTSELRARLAVDDVAGTSRALADVFRQVSVASAVPIAVLITGESGTGKTKIARALHESSPRKRGPFVEINCAALPETLFESELFGAEKGAHSTANRRIEGKIDAAKGGTLFLDEVGEIPLASQGKLLQFLQSKRYFRLGGSAPIDADVRVVTATNASLDELVQAKRFREDLYYRLNVLEVRVPPLRDRREDIATIADAIVRALSEHHGAPRVLPLSRASHVALSENDWPGNVRQLENVLSRGWAVALSEGAMSIEPKHLFADRAPASETEGESGQATYEEAMRRFQAKFLQEALDASNWNVSETARRIGLARSHLNDLIKAHRLSRPPR
jgi:DNA-binding NtrC family response regulator